MAVIEGFCSIVNKHLVGFQNCWLVVRIDGKAFHKFTDAHKYVKPNDERGIGLMSAAAQKVMTDFPEVRTKSY